VRRLQREVFEAQRCEPPVASPIAKIERRVREEFSYDADYDYVRRRQMRTLLLFLFSLATSVIVFAQDPTKLAPQNYKVLFENDQIRVIEYRLKPGEREPMHSHPFGVFVYFLSGAKIRTTFPDGKTSEDSKHTGETVWRDPVTHAGENIGDAEAHALLIEPKSRSQQSVLHTSPKEQRVSPQGYVLGPTEGDHLIRNAGSIFIKVDPSRSSNNMALGTQQVPKRTGIAIHQHQEADEVLFVLEGTGFGILGETRVPIEKGSAIYIPKGVWHGVENPDSELLLLWVVAPPGLEAFFREVASAPREPPKQLNREQLNEIARKHGMQFK
jgi:quercetin dioxygenase-like cupin family protein